MNQSWYDQGIKSSLAFAREAEAPGWAERFFCTFKKQLPWARDFHTLKELAEALCEFRRRYNQHWLLERLNFRRCPTRS